MNSAQFEGAVDELRRMQLALPSLPETSLSDAALAWLLLAPVWPASIAERGFPIGDGALASGELVIRALDRAVGLGLLEVAQGEAPWGGKWYSMRRLQAEVSIEKLLNTNSDVLPFLQQQLFAMGRQLNSSSERMPPPLAKFAALARAASLDQVARKFDEYVTLAIDGAKERSAVVAPEANRWIEVMEPLGRIFGGDVEVAVARARRRVELFERRSRDDYYSRNYTPRAALEAALDGLLAARDDEGWALHMLGDGGMGKTMFIRQISSRHASARGLVTSRIDFDHLNPDYPTKAPGLLLMALAEDLRLADVDGVHSLLRKFDAVVGAAHRRVETGPGAASAPTVGGYVEHAESLFADVLDEIALEGVPLLILDTCEELARIRPDGELPDAVTKTFELLERLHRRVPKLRVLFSGRRHLASSGAGWQIDCARLPARPYLRRVLVDGFSDAEATAFLREYTQDGRRVESTYWPKILELSGLQQPSAGPGEAHRYNPYDLNLYASWVTSRDTHDPQALLSAGAHHYVRERILGRVSQWVAPWVPTLAQLRNFDRELLRTIAGNADAMSSNLLEEIVSQEWVDVAYGMQSGAVPPDGQPLECWTIDRNLAERLARYYREEKLSTWLAASSRLRAVMPEWVITRPLSMLIRSYFEVTFELLRDDVEATLAWWARVDAKICDDGAWSWALQVTERLLALRRSGEEGGVATDICMAAVLATDAAMRTKLGTEGSILQASWRGVLRLIEGLSGAHADRLRYRAEAGGVGCVRWFATPLSESNIGDFELMVLGVPSPPGLAEVLDVTSAVAEGEPQGIGSAALKLDPQLFGTEIAFLENVIEALEQIEWQGVPPEQLIRHLEQRGQRMSLASRALDLCPELDPYLDGLLQRLRMPESDKTLFQKLPAYARHVEEFPRHPAKPALLDWSWPEQPRARALLEWARAWRFVANPPWCRRLRSAAAELQMESLDSDRALAAVLLVQADLEIPDEPPVHWIRESVRINHEHAPQCCAHWWTPPYFQVALEVLADRGRVDEAVTLSREFVSNSHLHLRVRQAAERALLSIAIKWRLLEMGIGRQSSLGDSERPVDRLLAAEAGAFHPGVYFLGQRSERWAAPPGDDWLNVQRLSLVQTRWPISHYVRYSEYNVLGSELLLVSRGTNVRARPQIRIEASLALRAGSIELRRDLTSAARLLAWSAAGFSRRADVLGHLLALTATALLQAATTRDKKFLESVDELRHVYTSAMDQQLAPRLSFAGIMTIDSPARLSPRERTVWEEHGCWQPLWRRLWLCFVLAEWLRDRNRPTPITEVFGDLRACDVELVVRGLQGSIDEVVAPDGGAAAVQTNALSSEVRDEPRPAMRARSRVPATLFAVSVTFVTFITSILGGKLSIAGADWLNELLRFSELIPSGIRKVSALSMQQVAALAVAILAVIALPALMRMYVRLAERAVRLVVTVMPRLGPQSEAIAPMRFEYVASVEFARRGSERSTDGWAVRSYEEGAEQDLGNYSIRARAWAESDPVRVDATDALQVAINTDLYVPIALASQPWEAMFSLRHVKGFAGRRRSYRFRRSSPTRESIRLRSANPGALRRITAPSLIAIVEGGRSASHVWSDCWRDVLRDRTHFVADTGLELIRLHPEYRSHANILHIIQDMVETDQGLALRFGPSVQMFAGEVATRFPALRLAILQMSPRDSSRRLGNDVIEAARARVLAAQLYECGVPAVVVLPALPTSRCVEVLQPIVDVAMKRRASSTTALMYAVREVQDRIRAMAELHPDTAFDVCLYCVPDLDLSISR